MSEAPDRTRVQREPCPECGFDPEVVDDRRLGWEIVAEGARFASTLAGADPAARARRPARGVWSALEYACHTRDVLEVFAPRIRRMLAEDDPELGWWDHEAAVVADGYADQDPVHVVEDLSAAARRLAAVLAEVPADGWDRTGRRRAGEVFTVRGAGRFALHEVVHHRHDATAAVAAAAPTGGMP